MTVRMYSYASLPATCVVLALICFQSPVSSLKHKNLICSQVKDCVCENSLGQSINLTNLELKPLILNDTQHSLVFHFNPCGEVHLPCPVGSFLCVHDEKLNVTTNLGVKGGAIYSSQGLDDPVFINYEYGGIETEVQLECSVKNETTLLLNVEEGADTNLKAKYHLRLQSPEACLRTIDSLKDDVSSGDLSTGSALFIAFLVMASAYLFLGAAANHFIRGATGWEMIPNYQLWRRVPTLFMDGLKFVANGCRPPPSYEQI